MKCFFCRKPAVNTIRCDNCKHRAVTMSIFGKGFANKREYIRNMQMGHMNELRKEAEKLGINVEK